MPDQYSSGVGARDAGPSSSTKFSAKLIKFDWIWEKLRRLKRNLGKSDLNLYNFD